MNTTTRNSAQWLALRLTEYVGVTDFSPAPSSNTPDASRAYLTDGMLDAIAGIETAGLQDIFVDGGAALSEADSGASLFAPATLAFSVTPGAATANVASGWLPGMVGCSCLIGGDGFVNEVVSALTAVGYGTTVTLRRPYLGASAGSVQATVFCTSIPLPAGTINVLEPVETPNNRELRPCADRAEFDALSGCRLVSPSIYTGWPSRYLVEMRNDASLTAPPLFLRIAPAPQMALPITFRVRLGPPVIQTADLGSQTADPGKMFPIPGQWVESILLPYCLQRWTGSPLFKNETVKPEIQRQFLAAKARLASFKPQVARTGGTVGFPP